ncbi:MAG: P-II family nitrogen regulator [Coriobacteriia bacterium]
MKEICAIIRRDKLQQTKAVLAETGYPAMTIQSVEGRGRQKGDVACTLADMDQDGASCNSLHVKLRPTPSTYALEHTLPKVALFVPKRMITLMVPDEAVDAVVQAIISANTTGQPGDGRVFVCPVEGASTIRTGERETAVM